jgi:outer membrane lipoprotein SlyB
MTRTPSFRASTAAVSLVALMLAAQVAHAQSQVRYGRITAVAPTTVDNNTGRNVGRVVGGGIGLASGSGQSSSNRALRTVGGAAVGGRVGDRATRTQAFEYTVLVGGTNTIRIVSDQAGKRVGDCVAVEQGQFANIRLVPDARCAPPPRPAAAPTPAPARPATPRPAAAPAAAPAPAPAPAPVVDPADQQAANACEQVKLQVVQAVTDEEFNLAERRMRLVCGE